MKPCMCMFTLLTVGLIYDRRVVENEDSYLEQEAHKSHKLDRLK